MKNKLFISLCLILTIAACRKDNPTVTPANDTSKTTVTTQHGAGRLPASMADTESSKFIPMTVANQMINSYLSSISANTNDTDVRSYSINADSLRAFLDNTSIKNVKLILAHTMNYINAGHYGVPAGYQSGAMTIIIAAYDESGNYIYYRGNNVLDHVAPCPYSCPPGQASNSLLQQ